MGIRTYHKGSLTIAGLIGALMVYSLAYIWASQVWDFSPSVRYAVIVLSPFPCSLLAAHWCWRAYSASRDTYSASALGWLFLMGGSLFFAASSLSLFLLIYTFSVDASTLLLPHALALIGYVSLIAGLAMFTPRTEIVSRLSHVVDILLICLSVLFIVWVFCLEHVYLASHADMTRKAFSLLYPLADLALLVSCLTLVQAAPRRGAMLSVASLMAPAIILMLVGDCTYIHTRLQRTELPPVFFDPIWVWPFVLMACGGMRVVQKSASHDVSTWERVADPAWNLASSLLSLGTAAVLLIANYLDAGNIGLPVLLMASSLVALFIGRQFLAMARSSHLLHENQDYATRVQAFTHELERTVGQRTRHLRALHAVTAATNASLEEKEVLQLGVEGALGALEGDGAGVWFGNDTEPFLVCGRFEHLPAVRQRIAYLQQHGSPSPETFVSDLQVVYGHLFNPDGLAGKIVVWRYPRSFDPDDGALVESIGLVLGAALHNARTYARVAQEAECDPMTGLMNLRTVQARMNVEIQRSGRSGQPLAVLMMDMDDFKSYNDTFGHLVGDGVLKHVANVLRAGMRPFDLLGRYGGDEFIAVLPSTDQATAERVGERIRRVLYEGGFMFPCGNMPLRISYGLAVYPDDGLGVTEIVQAADRRMYAAKAHQSPCTGVPEDLREGLPEIPGYQTLDAMMLAVNNRDRFTLRHAENVTRHALEMARQLGWDEDRRITLRLAGLLHNVGMIAVPEKILRKPGDLDPEEMAALRRHSEFGYALTRALNMGPDLENAVRHHHENWDGSGYPVGLSGKDIPEIARLLAVADAFCAMTAHRPYRRAMSPEAALEQIRRGSGTIWDPEMVHVLSMIVEHSARSEDSPSEAAIVSDQHLANP